MTTERPLSAARALLLGQDDPWLVDEHMDRCGVCSAEQARWQAKADALAAVEAESRATAQAEVARLREALRLADAALVSLSAAATEVEQAGPIRPFTEMARAKLYEAHAAAATALVAARARARQEEP